MANCLPDFFGFSLRWHIFGIERCVMLPLSLHISTLRLVAFVVNESIPAESFGRYDVSPEEFARSAAYVARCVSGRALVRLGVVVRLSGVDAWLLNEVVAETDRSRKLMLARLLVALPLCSEARRLCNLIAQPVVECARNDIGQ